MLKIDPVQQNGDPFDEHCEELHRKGTGKRFSWDSLRGNSNATDLF